MGGSPGRPAMPTPTQIWSALLDTHTTSHTRGRAFDARKFATRKVQDALRALREQERRARGPLPQSPSYQRRDGLEGYDDGDDGLLVSRSRPHTSPVKATRRRKPRPRGGPTSRASPSMASCTPRGTDDGGLLSPLDTRRPHTSPVKSARRPPPKAFSLDLGSLDGNEAELPSESVGPAARAKATTPAKDPSLTFTPVKARTLDKENWLPKACAASVLKGSPLRTTPFALPMPLSPLSPNTSQPVPDRSELSFPEGWGKLSSPPKKKALPKAAGGPAGGQKKGKGGRGATRQRSGLSKRADIGGVLPGGQPQAAGGVQAGERQAGSEVDDAPPQPRPATTDGVVVTPPAKRPKFKRRLHGKNCMCGLGDQSSMATRAKVRSQGYVGAMAL